ncbi:hypothetical protein [Saccharothrix algeriensis]|uniref:Uncharacterized protein n=1 Tax=Saccharothrix algeriensis TaxID=173560 RepID=A0A8T8I1Q0_9PSEU|nr:hypothetical protein [Saccharothrix algeriensis]MBM7810495.1 hypothetical protein [Saccharothrix algeriensis]QTR04619.1 hypothetical protein J7S33_07130 [Saccharothrix algeriensis]
MTPLVYRTDISHSADVAVLTAARETAPPLECCGCPDDDECREYCVANYGAVGGYCEGFLDLRCVCVY